jgi:hypothetical protein
MKIGMATSQANNLSENKLPSQSEVNPKSNGQCGAISTVDSITTRGGKIITPLLPNPLKQTYVPPPRRIVTPEEETINREQATGNLDIEHSVQKDTNVKTTYPPKIPFPERLEKSKEEKQYTKFLEKMKEVQVTIPILDAVLHVPMYAKFFKELLTKKRALEEPEVVTLTKVCSAVLQNSLPEKLDDPGSFCIPCCIGTRKFTALCDLGSSVNVLPLSVCKNMPLGDLHSTSMTLQLADRTFRKPAGVLLDVPIVVEKFAYPVDFVVLEMEESSEAVILGRPFLATAGAIINVKQGTISLSFGDDEIIFNMKDPTHLPHCSYRCFAMDVVDSCILETYERCEAQPEIDEDLLVRPCLNAVMQTSIIEQAEASTEELGQYALNLQPNSVVQLKPLPAHLTYQFLEPEKGIW